MPDASFAQARQTRAPALLAMALTAGLKGHMLEHARLARPRSARAEGSCPAGDFG
jgi:hypothetical protein